MPSVQNQTPRTPNACHPSAVLVLLFLMLGWAGHAFGGNSGVLLYWDGPPANETIASYRIFYGTHTKSYTNSFLAYDPSGVVLTGLPSNNTYYFAVQATDTNGINSPLSNEASLTLSTAKPVVLQTQIYTDGNGVPTGMYITGTNSVTTDWEMDSSTDLIHWSYFDENHGINISEFVYFGDSPSPRMFYRVFDTQ